MPVEFSVYEFTDDELEMLLDFAEKDSPVFFQLLAEIKRRSLETKSPPKN